MSAKFLGSTGLTQLVTLIKNILTLKADSANGSGGVAKRAAAIPFGQVDSTSTSTAFTATIPGITELHSGVCVFLMNGVVTSASGFTVNINNLGAKPVYSTLSAASRSTTQFNVAYTLLLVYNEERISGGCWDAYYGYDSNTNTIGYQLRTNSTTMPTLDKFYRYRLLFTAADRKHLVPANTSSSTSADTAKTTTQRPIDPFGAIYYYGHTTAISANANPTASYFWTQYSFALGYSFNRTGAALTLTNHAPVYIKCAPQADGSAIIDADNPFVQTLPSTADGKIYIFLGVASSATAVELVPEHPVYYYDGGIKLWLGREVYTKPSTGIPASDLDSDVQTSLGKADTALQTAPVTSVNGKTGAVSLRAADVGALPANTHIPADAIWRGEWSVSTSYDVGDFVSYGGVIYHCNTGGIGIYPDEETGWDEWFGAAALGAYVKPSGGIPKTDLAQSVQTSLGKADTALQSHQDISGKADKANVYTKTEIDNKGYQTATQVQTAISGKANSADLATVATSGSYNDLSDKPSIPDEPFVIPLNHSLSQDTWTTTATAAEIRANADNCVVVVSKDEQGEYRIPLKFKIYDGGANQLLHLIFSAMMVAGDVSAMDFMVMLSGDNVSVTYFQANLYSKPSGGIPASDLAAGVIPDISGKANSADVYTKTEVDQKLVGAMDYKGTKATTSDLPTSGNKTGDVWHINTDGSERAWNGSAWEELGTAVDLSGKQDAPLIGQAYDSSDSNYITPRQVATALADGKDVTVEWFDSDFGTLFFTAWNAAGSGNYAVVVSNSMVHYNNVLILYQFMGEVDNARWSADPQIITRATDLATVAISGSYYDLSNKPTIPSEVTEQTVSGWGFTKNTGTYSKPSGGIPKTDLASDVQTSLGKADTALQQHQSLSAYRTASAQDAIDSAQDTAIAAKYTKPSSGIPASDIADGVIPTVPTTEINANTAARHTHSNKALLDSYSQTEANLADAVSKKHTHTNKTVLDGITSSKVSGWDNKQDAISDLATIRSGAAAGATAVQPSAINDMATQTWVGQQGYQTATQVENAIPIKSVQVNGTALTPDANKAVNIQLAQIAYTLEDNGETLYISNIIELPSSENTSF